MAKITTMRKYFTGTRLSKALSTEERSKFLNEIMRAGGDKDTIIELNKEEKEEGLPPEAMLVGAFDWSTSKYGAIYWNSVYNKVKSFLYGVQERAEDIVPLSESMVKRVTFEAKRNHLEQYLRTLGYRQASLHEDDKHTWYSKDKMTRVEMNGGFLQVSSHVLNVHSIGYKEIQGIVQSHKSVLVTLNNGTSIVIGR